MAAHAGKDPGALIGPILAWARGRDDVAGLALVGSHARGEARPDSDVDVMVLVEGTDAYVSDTAWAGRFGKVQAAERWGSVTSIRLWADDVEVELGIVPLDWAAVDPADEGTARVVRDGLRILYDPRGLLAQLVEAVG